MGHHRIAALVALPVAAGSLLVGSAGGPPPCSTAALTGAFAMSGTGAYAGRELRAVQTLVFDGKGHVTGKGTAVIDAPILVVPYEAQQGTYALNADCTGTMRWFGHHPTIPVADHFHNADFAVSDGGREVSLIYTNTEFPNGLPQPIESVTLTGRHI